MRRLTFLLLLLLLLPVVRQTKADDPWWDTNWKYRAKIIFNNTNSYTIYNFPFNITVNTASLISQGRLNSDCSDLRFVFTNGTEIKHHVFDCNSPTTHIALLLNLSSGETSFYMYYGNPSATSTDDPTITLDNQNIYDPFDTLDGSLWACDSTYTAGLVCTISSGQWKIGGSGTNWGYSKRKFWRGLVFETYVNPGDYGGSAYQGLSSTIASAPADGPIFGGKDNYNAILTGSSAATSGTDAYHTWRIEWYYNGTAAFYVDGGLDAVLSDTAYYGPVQVYFRSVNDYSYVDWVNVTRMIPTGVSYAIPTVESLEIGSISDGNQTVSFNIFYSGYIDPNSLTVLFDVKNEWGDVALTDVEATYDAVTGKWKGSFSLSGLGDRATIYNVRVMRGGTVVSDATTNAIEHTIDYIALSRSTPFIIAPRDGSTFHRSDIYVLVNTTSVYNTTLVIESANGSTSSIPITEYNTSVVLSEGENYLYLRYTNLIDGSTGETQPIRVLVDLTPPDVVALIPSTVISCQTADFWVNATDVNGIDKVVVLVERDGELVFSGEATERASDGYYHVFWTGDKAEGTYNITVRAYDVANRSTEVVGSFNVITGGTTAFITSPKPSSVFYTSEVNVTWLAPLFNSTLTVEMPNGTTSYFAVEGLSNMTLQLAEGRNWITLNGTLCDNVFYSQPVDVVIDQYLPNAPTITQPVNNANLTQDLVNVSWTHDGFDVEWFDVKAWRYEPSYWASSVTVPIGDSWQLIQLAGSGTYYLQVVARDAAGNEASSDVVMLNVSASTIGLLNMTLNRTGFSFSLMNTLNESQDANWNLTISLLTGQQVDFRQGVLSFYPNETKVYNGTWNQNLSDNVYIAEFWVEDSYGRASGYITSFLAIPPFSEQGVIPLSISQGPWEPNPLSLGERIKLSSTLLITNANNVESPQQAVTFSLPTNTTVESAKVKNKLTGSVYSATLNATAGTGSFVAPAIAPYSSVVFSIEATTNESVTASFTKVDGASGIKTFGDKLYRIYNVTITNPSSFSLLVYLDDNETMRWDCPSCTISGGRQALQLAPQEMKHLRAYFEEKQEAVNLTQRPLSALLDFMSTTNLGVLISMFVGFLIPIAVVMRWEIGAPK